MKLNILGYDYNLSLALPLDGLGPFGRLNAKGQIIQVANDLHPQQALSTVVHEIIEAIDFHTNLKLEQSQISTLETGLFQALTANGVDLSPLLTGGASDGGAT